MGRNDTTGDSIGTAPDVDDSTGKTTGRWSRIASTALGGALVVAGLRRRSLGGAVATFTGGWLVYRGITGGRGGDESSERTVGTAEDDGGEERAESTADWTEITASITIDEPADEVYGTWRDPETLTRIFGEFADVFAPDEDSQQFVLPGPLGVDVTWDTRIVEDRPGEFLRWESVDDSTIPHEGTVSFRPAPNDQGTEVTLRIRFDHPGGAVVESALRHLDVVPDALAGTALRRFKSLVETGEIPDLSGNPSGRGKGDLV